MANYTSAGSVLRVSKGVYVSGSKYRIEYCYDPSGAPHSRNGWMKWKATNMISGKVVAHGPSLKYVCEII